MAVDPNTEISAMQALAETLKTLEGDVPAAQRVLGWAVAAFLPSGSRIVTYAPPSSEDVAITPGMGISVPTAQAKQAKRWESLPELFSAVTLGSDAERALVVAYWMQKVQGESLRRLHHQQGVEAPGLCGQQHHLGPDAADRAQAAAGHPNAQIGQQQAGAQALPINERGIACRRAIARRRHYRLGLQRAPVA